MTTEKDSYYSKKMPIADIAFYAMLFFCIGVTLFAWINALGGAVLVGAIFALAVLAAALSFPEQRKTLFPMLCISWMLIAGSLYAGWFSVKSRSAFEIPIGAKEVFYGVVSGDPEFSNGRQTAEVSLTHPYSGKILARLRPYPRVRYGDAVSLDGVVTVPEPDSYAEYLAKKDIYGIMNYPRFEIRAHDQASMILKNLFALKRSFEEKLTEILPLKEGAFAAGILLGERGAFSPEFEDAMKVSGTTHLVALSGYNISIIAMSVLSLVLGLGIHRKIGFWISIAVISAFVVMTGAEASVVRAAIMGGILMFAGYAGYQQNIRQAIMIAATVMVAANPRIVLADAGFQLSFLALVGIVYCAPAMERLLFPAPIGNVRRTRSFFGWRENLCATMGAQLMALPVLVYHFHQVSAISLVSNILILEIVPLAMALAFSAGALGYISHALSVVAGWVAYVPLAYQTGVIEFFGRFSIAAVTIDHISLWVFGAYYGAIAFWIYRVLYRNKNGGGVEMYE